MATNTYAGMRDELYLVLYPPGPGRVWVSPTGNDGNNGTSISTPKQSIGAALGAVGSGGIVWMLDGNYGQFTVSGRNGSSSAWTHLISVNERGAVVTSQGDRGIQFSNCSYFGFFGIDAGGMDDVAHQYQDAIGATGNVNHIAVWKCHTHNGAGAGIAFAGNLGYMNNVSICYNTSHTNSRYLSTAGSGIGCFQFSDNVGTLGGTWAALHKGYDNVLVGNVSYDNVNDPSTAASDGNGIIIDDMQNTQGYSLHQGVPYTGNWLLANNLTLDNGGRGVHAFLSNRVDEFFNTCAHNMKASNDTNSGDISQVFTSGGRADFNVVKIGPFFGRTKWISQYSTDAVFDTNVCLAGDPNYGVNTRNRANEGFNYFANNAPTLAPSTAALAAQWRPDGGSAIIEKVVLSQTDYDKLSMWPDLFGDYRPARTAGWAIGVGEGTAATPQPPTADFTFTPATAFTGQTVTFTDKSTGATSWAWDFSDGGTSTAQNPTHTFTSVFNRNVKLTVTNAQGSNSITKTVVVRDPLNGISFQAEDAVVTSGYPADTNALHIITENSGYEGTGYAGHWGQPGEKLTWTVAAPNGAGAYTLTVRYKALDAGTTRAVFINGVSAGEVSMPTNIAAWSDPWGYTPSLTVTLTAGTNTIEFRHIAAIYTKYADVDSFGLAAVGVVAPPPTASFDYGPTTVYVGQSVQFNDHSTGAPTAWEWTFGDEPPVSGLSGTLIRTEAGDTIAARGTVGTASTGTLTHPASGSPGHLVSSTAQGTSPAGHSRYLITYQMTASAGNGGGIINATGIAYVPSGSVPSGGRRFITAAHGIMGSGLLDSEAASTYNPNDTFGNSCGDVDGWLNAGYVVVQTDYEGITRGGDSGLKSPTYSSRSVARAMLDAARALAGLTTVKAAGAAVGFSQGGHAALCCGEWQQSYASEIQQFCAVGFDPWISKETTDGYYQFGYGDDVVTQYVWGLWVDDPTLPLNVILNSGGQARLPNIESYAPGGYGIVTPVNGGGTIAYIDNPVRAGSGWSTAANLNSPGNRKGVPSRVYSPSSGGLYAGDIWLSNAQAQGTAASRVVTGDTGHAVHASYQTDARTYIQSTLDSQGGVVVGPSGQAMPVGNLAGWRQIYTQDFSTPHATGTFGPLFDNVPSEYAGKLHVYEDGWPDTAGKPDVENQPSRYMPTQVLSVANGTLIKKLFNSGSGARSAAVVCGDAQLYGRYTIRFRADSTVGFKTAWLLWPQSGVWPRDGEIDFPEGNLNSTISGFMHRQGATSGSDQDYVATSTTYTGWHTATIEWAPSSLKFFMDGVQQGSTITARVPNTPMQWVIQTESALGYNQPPIGTTGYLYIDWLAMYAYDLSVGAVTTTATPGNTRVGWIQLNDEVTSSEATASAPKTDVIVLTPWFTTSAGLVKAANPAIKVLAYHNIYVTVNDGFQYNSANDPSNGNHGDWSLPFSGGMGYGYANAVHPEWFELTAANARYQYSDYAGRWIMKAYNTAYQNQYAANIVAECAARGYDGVFLDDAVSTAAPHGLNGSPAYDTDAEVKAATASFVANIGARLKAAGLLCIPNVAGIALTAGLWAEWDQLGTGMFEEKFMFWSPDPANWQGADTTKYMAQGIAHPDFNPTYPNANFNFVNTYGSVSTIDTTVEVAHALYLCYNDGGAVFTISPAPDTYDAPSYVSPEMGWKLGAETSPRTEITAYTFIRKFAKGCAVVRIDDGGGTVTVSLGGTYYDRAGTSYTSVTLGNKSAKVLKTNSGTGAP